jgi:hypothetical protein
MGDQKPTAAFVLSLLAGIFIMIGGGVRIVMGALMRRYGAYRGMMGGFGFSTLLLRGLGVGFRLIGILAVVFGIIVVVAALMLYVHPSGHVAWGLLILIFSILSVFGSLFGIVLGILGGIFAIIWHPHT